MSEEHEQQVQVSQDESQSEIVRRALSKEIMTGRLRPGQFLSESSIGKRFSVSRTPVREAIRSLAADGLVTLRQRQRAVVRGQTIGEILDQFELMAELEAACTRLAALRRSANDVDRMEAAQEECVEMSRLADLERYYAANVRFHEAIYTASGNSCLEAQTRNLRDRLRLLRISQGGLPGRLAASSREHQTILDAIKAQDEARAADAMRQHLIVQGESLRCMLNHTDTTGVVHLRSMAETMRFPLFEEESAL